MQSINHYLPKEHEIQEILNKVHSVCVFGSKNKFSKIKLDKNSLSPVAYAQQVKLTELNPFISKMSGRDLVQAECYEAYAMEEKEPKDDETRRSYLAGLATSVKLAGYSFAAGGCEPMADIAFLEALNKEFPCGIHYIRFSNQNDSKVEEINAVVLGEWPNPGCLVVSPWEEDFGTSYIWNGSCKETPRLYGQNLTDGKVLFSVSSPAEKAFVKSLLKTWNYEDWLNDPFLISNKKEIKANFLKIIHNTGFFKILNYQDYLNWGSTSKSHYKELKEKQLLISKEAAEKLLAIAK